MFFSEGVTDIISRLLDGVAVFFVLYLIGYSTFLFLSVVVGASHLYQRRREVLLENVSQQNYYLPVSILVPAYNEQVTVVDTVRSLLELDYSAYEIVVVDDGSKDDTAELLIRAFNMHKIQRPVRSIIPCQPLREIYETKDYKVPVTLIMKQNGGKADSLNMGINACRYPYFVCMDADSMLQYDSLREIVRPVLQDDRIVAVGGSVRPSNDVKLKLGRVLEYNLPRSILACMQVLEYDRSFLASRILLDLFNGSLIISGAFGLFRKDVVQACGGYDASLVGEDMELVVKLHEFCLVNERPYKISYATGAICWSQVPERLQDLRKQRRRWHIGLFQSMKEHTKLLANPKFGAVSLVSYLYFLLYELFSPYIEVLGVAAMVLAYMIGKINVTFMLMFMGIYAGFGAILTLTAFFSRIQTIDLKISLSDVGKALMLCLFEITILRFVMVVVRFTALFGYGRKKHVWGAIKRVSNAQVEPEISAEELAAEAMAEDVVIDEAGSSEEAGMPEPAAEGMAATGGMAGERSEPEPADSKEVEA